MKIKEVREKIDKIDSEIVDLLSKRSSLVSKACKVKESEHAVRDPERVEAVIKRVRQKAVKAGLDPLIIEKIYRNIIDCFIHREMVEFKGMKIEYQDV